GMNEKFDDVFRRCLVMDGPEQIKGRCGRERRFPFVPVAGSIGGRHGRKPIGDIEDAGGVFGALHIAGKPVQTVGVAAEHGVYSLRTQVSLMPPPWLELTTSEPFLKATRVKPPGTIRTPSRPLRTKGRRSTWRGSMPPSAMTGQVESGRVDCAM